MRGIHKGSLEVIPEETRKPRMNPGGALAEISGINRDTIGKESQAISMKESRVEFPMECWRISEKNPLEKSLEKFLREPGKNQYTRSRNIVPVPILI